MLVGKTLLDEDILWIMPTSIKGRHSTDAEMNAESFEHHYFPETEIVFAGHISKVRC